MDLRRLLDHYRGWKEYRDDVPFKVYLCLGKGYCVPRRVYNPNLEGYFILSSDKSIVHLFNPDLKLYKKEEGFKCIVDGPKENKNGILYIKKAPEVEALFIDNQLFILKNNFYYENGWYQQLTKV